MHRPFIALLLSLHMAACIPAAWTSQSTARPTLAIVRVGVIDVDSGRVLADQTVLIAGNRIQEIGESARVSVPDGTRIVDGAGKYLIPGLWDMHAHVNNRWDRAASLYVANGVTGVRDMGGLTPVATLRERLRTVLAGEVVGPRFIAAGRYINDGAELSPSVTARVRNADEARRVVDSLADAGVDFLKIYGSLSHESFHAIAARARERRMPFAGHVPADVGALEASNAGMRSFEHNVGFLEACSADAESLTRFFRGSAEAWRSGTRPSGRSAESDSAVMRALRAFDAQRCAELGGALARNGTWVTPTLVQALSVLLPGEDSIRTARLKYVPVATRDDWARRRPQVTNPGPLQRESALTRRRTVKALNDGGALLLAGTDAADFFIDAVPGFALHDELRLLELAGLSRLQALRAATLDAARYLGAMDSLGTVARGKLADLVLLDANPLEELRNTQRIAAVIHNGRYLDRRDLDAVLALVERTVAR